MRFSINQQSYCFSCGRCYENQKPTSVRILCSECYNDLPFFNQNTCVISGSSSPIKYSYEAMGLNDLRAIFYYRGQIARAIKSFKYNGSLYSLKFLRGLCADWATKNEELLREYDAIVAVPSHIVSLLKRGLNPASAIISKVIGIEQRHHLLKKIRRLPPMASQNAVDRKKLKRSRLFECGEDLSGKSVLIFDDVMSTGTTLENLAYCLREKGAVKVSALILARNQKQEFIPNH